jgi:hypothetical protein
LVEKRTRTLTDWVGAASATLVPRVEAIRALVFAGKWIHDDGAGPRQGQIRTDGYGPTCVSNYAPSGRFARSPSVEKNWTFAGSDAGGHRAAPSRQGEKHRRRFAPAELLG